MGGKGKKRLRWRNWSFPPPTPSRLLQKIENSPALFTRMSIDSPPNASSAARTHLGANAASVTSPANAAALPAPLPAALLLISAATLRAFSPSRSATRTQAPCDAKRRAAAAPRPWPAPVMMATLNFGFGLERQRKRKRKREVGVERGREARDRPEMSPSRSPSRVLFASRLSVPTPSSSSSSTPPTLSLPSHLPVEEAVRAEGGLASCGHRGGGDCRRWQQRHRRRC